MPPSLCLVTVPFTTSYHTCPPAAVFSSLDNCVSLLTHPPSLLQRQGVVSFPKGGWLGGHPRSLIVGAVFLSGLISLSSPHLLLQACQAPCSFLGPLALSQGSWTLNKPRPVLGVLLHASIAG